MGCGLGIKIAERILVPLAHISECFNTGLELFGAKTNTAKQKQNIQHNLQHNFDLANKNKGGEESALHLLSVVNAAIYLENGSFVRIDSLRGTVHKTERVRMFQTIKLLSVPATTKWQHSLLPNLTYLQRD